MAKQLTIVRKFQDKILVTQSKAGTEQAYARIYDKYYDEIYRFVFFRTTNRETAEDLTADIFLKAWKHITVQKVHIDNVRALLYQIARYTIIDYYRKHKTLSLEGINLEVVDQSENVEQKIDRQMDLKKVAAALKELPVEQQEIIVMRYAKELSYDEIAIITGKRSGTVRVMIHRSMQRLQKIMMSRVM